MPAVIYQVESLNVLQESVDADTLVVFDVDNVLIVPSEPAFQFPNIYRHKALFKEIVATLSPEEFDALLNLTVLRFSSELLDGDTPRMISGWQREGVKTIALTAVWNGLGPEGQDLAERRRKILYEFGIDFSGAFADLTHVSFEHYEQDFGPAPLFYEGILFSGRLDVDKGQLLVDFLQQIPYLPKRVVFVDDWRKNVDNMEAALQKAGIEHIGYHYTAASSRPAELLSEEQFKEALDRIVEEARRLVSTPQ